VITRKSEKPAVYEGFDSLIERVRLKKGVAVQRLYSTFARGWPGVGLLFLRQSAAIVAFHFSGDALALNRSDSRAMIEGAAALLLCAGLWTPIAGGVLAGLASWTLFSRTDDRWALILLAAVGLALAMLGPGAWSIDARLFGRKRLTIKR
jgi:putative oxidoreductase